MHRSAIPLLLFWLLAVPVALPAAVLPSPQPCDEADGAGQAASPATHHDGAGADCDGKAPDPEQVPADSSAHGDACGDACALLCALGSAPVGTFQPDTARGPLTALAVLPGDASAGPSASTSDLYRPPRRLNG